MAPHRAICARTPPCARNRIRIRWRNSHHGPRIERGEIRRLGVRMTWNLAKRSRRVDLALALIIWAAMLAIVLSVPGLKD